MSDVAVVTGASSGFGLLASVELARRGLRVVATMRNLERKARIENALAAAGVQARLARLDVTDSGSIAAAIADVDQHEGRVDVLVNNAGFGMGGFLEDLTMDELREQMETNFFGLVAVTKAVVSGMRDRRHGRIINVTSISGRVALPGLGAYAASKFAVEGLSESLRHELLPHGVFVSVVEPGTFRTDIFDRNRRLGARVSDESSPNYQAAQRLLQLVDERVAASKADPQRVANTIADIAQAARPGLRHLVGYDAYAEYTAARALPWRAWERLLARATRLGR